MKGAPPVASVILFHSVYGLRPVELGVAELMRSAGHAVVTPDLYAGQTADSLDEGFELVDRVGWSVICRRAASAVAALPDETVLAGFSMGASVAESLWPNRPRTSGVLLLHALADIPDTAPAGLPVQVHLADPDAFAPAQRRAAWQAAAKKAGLAAQIFTYPAVGHFFTDASLPDYDAEATRRASERILVFLGQL